MGEEDREERRHRHHHHHHHRDKDRERNHRHKDDEDRHRRKKRRHHDSRERSRRREDGEREEDPKQKGKSLADEFADDMMDDEELSQQGSASKIERESWMTGEENGNKEDPFSSFLGAVREKKPVEKPKSEEFGRSARELNTALHEEDSASSTARNDEYVPPSYTIGDDGSPWRMMKLKNLRTAAKDQMRPVEDLAVERLGSLQAYDEAREEEQELERRNRDYKGDGVMKVKITGELWLQRLAKEEEKVRKVKIREAERYSAQKMSKVTADDAIPQITQSDLNRMRAALLRAEMSNSPDVERLTKEYNAAVEKFNVQPAAPEVVVLPSQHSALMPHLSRETSKSETEMTIEDMVREERANKRANTAAQILRDKKYQDNLDYMDENAERLAQTTRKKEINLKNQSIQDFKKQERIMENCPLCYKDDGRVPPAPVIALGTRTYLSLPTEPELTEDGAMIVPIRHAKNLAECDDDEWEEIRNFMKCLMQFYAAKGNSVIFYEDASHPGQHKHPALVAVPIDQQPFIQAPAYFTQAFNTAESEWATHRPIIRTDTPELGKWGFRKRIPKEAPYFHVWFSLEGGMGHIVEDEERWGNGEMWVRSVLGSGLLDIERSVWGKMGRWTGYDKRVEGFKKKWEPYDWTKALETS